MTLPGISAEVELLPLDPISLDGPQVSAGRFERARRLADETVASLRRGDLPRAVDRLLALADEFPTAERMRAVSTANRARAREEARSVLLATRVARAVRPGG